MVADKPHAVFLPFPTQGHITPAFKFALLLHRKGFHITFVNTDYNHRRLLSSRAAVLTSLDFQFESIPDGLPNSDSGDKTQDIPSLFLSTKLNCLAPFRSLLQRLNAASSQGIPQVTCIVSDAIMTFSVTAAREIGVPVVCFRTTSVKSFVCNKNIPLLIHKGLLPLKDAACVTNGYLDTPVDWIPGLKNIRLREFPTVVRTTAIDDPLFSFVLGEMETASKASALVFNSFDALEDDALTALTSMCPRIYCIGPVHAQKNDLKSMEMSLWKEEFDCLRWLDSRKPNSVVYMNFGSITVLTPQQIEEFAWGITNSGKDYLWIIRPDSVVGDAPAESYLPPELVSQTNGSGRGVITGWCPQLLVLNHSSVAVFLTHCGWNSVVESLSSGVPMICWPFFADQPANCRQACVEWGVGVEIDKEIMRDGVERIVREMVDGDEGKKMKERAMEWKKKVEDAVGVGGSSFLNLDSLVEDVLLSNV